MTEMTINKLPSKTWYWLHVNETKLPWDKEHTTELPEETVTAGNTEEVRFSITGEERYSSKKIHIIAPAGKQVTVFMDYQTEEKLAVRTSLRWKNMHGCVWCSCSTQQKIPLCTTRLRRMCKKRPYRAGTDLSRKRRYLFRYDHQLKRRCEQL